MMVARTFDFVPPDHGHAGCMRIDAVRRLLRCNKGISSVEFALILPVLMIFLFSIIAFASTLYVQVNMENAAREAVRYMAVGEAPAAGAEVSCSSVQATTTGTAENYACIYLVEWPVSFRVTARIDGVCVVGGVDDRDAVVTVEVDADEVALADVFGFFDGRKLTAEVVMRPEAACV